MRNRMFSLSALLLIYASTVIGKEPIEIGVRLELFVDDFLIDKFDGDAKLEQKFPEAHDVALVTDKPWEGNTSAYYTVLQDDNLFRMYYRGSHWDTKSKKAAHPEVTCYAESKDGITWTKPELGLFEFDGSKKNNIVWDGIGTHCFAVFKDKNEYAAADAKYKAIARGRPRGKKGLYTFKSPDGIHWKQMSDEPVITEGAFDSQNLAFYDPVEGIYRDYHRTFVDGVRAIMTCTSKDFRKWSKPKLLDHGDAPKQHLYTNAVQCYDRAPHILIGFPTRYLPKEASRVEPTFMSSRDGVNFRRWLDPVVPESAPKDRGGNRSNYMAWGVMQLPGNPDELSVYATEAYYTGPDSRIRRFSYRLDGFVSVNAAKSGTMQTKPISFAGDKLVLNYACGRGGSVVVEVQSGEGKSLATSEQLKGDETKATVKWSKGSLKSLAGKPVRLIFKLQNADLYSMRFGA